MCVKAYHHPKILALCLGTLVPRQKKVVPTMHIVYIDAIELFLPHHCLLRQNLCHETRDRHLATPKQGSGWSQSCDHAHKISSKVGPGYENTLSGKHNSFARLAWASLA